MTALERYASALSSGCTSDARALDVGRDLTALGEYLVRLRNANQPAHFGVACRVWVRVLRRTLYRDGYRLAGSTQRRLTRDSLKAWAFALCPLCKGGRTACAPCGGLGVVIPNQWATGVSREAFEAALAALDSRYSDAVRTVYRSARREQAAP